MKRLLVTTHTEDQAQLLISLAKELHLRVELLAAETEDSLNLLRLAESSFAKEWNSPEDEHWDSFLENAKDVQTR